MNTVHYLFSDTPNSVFPEMFRNQVYVSVDASFDFDYITPFTIKYTASGYEDYRIDKKAFRIPANHYLIVNSGRHVECCDSPSQVASSVFLTPELVNDVYRSQRQTWETAGEGELSCTEFQLAESVNPGDDPLGGFMQRWIRSRLAQRDAPVVGREFFYSVTELLLQTHADKIKKLSPMRPAARNEVYRRLLIGKEYLHSNWDRQVPLEEVAHVACMSPYHFHRLFKRTFGVTPTKMHLRYKCELAKAWLSSGRTVTSCASQFGFADVFTFSKVFHREMGTPPSSFR